MLVNKTGVDLQAIRFILRITRQMKGSWFNAQSKTIYVTFTEISYRHHTTVKTAGNMKSVSRVKLPYFEGIFKL